MLSLKNKSRATLGAAIRVKPFLNKNALLVIYHSLMLSYIRYCITNWFHGNLAIVSQLQNICNKFIRLSFGLASEDDILPLMRRHNLLTIKHIFKHDVAIKPAVGSVAKRTLSAREVWGSIPGPVKSSQCRQRLATVATILRSCVAHALSRGDGPHNSLHASA